MQIELKGVRIVKSLSEETTCFSATLYVDGVSKGQVKNHGHGGPNEYDMPYQEQAAIDAWLKNNRPSQTYTYGGVTNTLEHDLDSEINDLLSNFEVEKQLRNAMRFALIVMAETGEKGAYYTWSTKKCPEERIRAHIATKFPGRQILNDLPFNQALAIFSAGSESKAAA